jgi:hypothetical protein
VVVSGFSRTWIGLKPDRIIEKLDADACVERGGNPGV